MKLRNLLQAVALGAVTVLLVTAVGCKGGCGGETTGDDISGHKIMNLGDVIPSNSKILVSSSDVLKLKNTVTQSSEWKRLAETSIFDDMLALEAFASFRQVLSDIARVTSTPLGSVLTDAALAGPGILSMRWVARRDIDYLLVKQLDLAQKAVAETVALWQRTGKEEVLEGTARKLYVFSVGHRELYSYIDGNVAVIGTKRDFVLESLELFLQSANAKAQLQAIAQHGALKSTRPATALSTIKGLNIDQTKLFSITKSFHEERVFKDEKGQPLWTSSLQGVALDYVPAAEPSDSQKGESAESGTIHLTMLHQDKLEREAEVPFQHHRYIPEAAPVYLGMSRLPMDWIAAKAGSQLRYNDSTFGVGLASAVGFDFNFEKLVEASLTGEGFYTFQGLNKRGVSQVLGLKLKPNVSPLEGLKAAWSKLFRGSLETSTLEHLEGAKLVCGNGDLGFEPFCFALHGDYLLMGLESAIRDALAAAVGKAPTVRDRKRLDQALASSETYVGAILIDVEKLSSVLFKHVEELSSRGLKRKHVKEVLGPWFDAVGAIDGLNGLLKRADDGNATATLQRL